MSDPKTPDVPAEETPAATQPHPGKPGVKDKGSVVTTAGGEPLSGHIADLADGDD